MINVPAPLAASAAVVPHRWFAALIPLGVESAGGVQIWHPDHWGIPGDALPANALFPVDLAAGTLPLKWDTDPGGPLGEVHTAGHVEAAWWHEGVVYVGGVLDLAVPGMVDLVGAVMAAGGEGRLRVAAVLTDVTYGEDDEGGTDYMTLCAWRLAAVRLELGDATPRPWPAPVGDLKLCASWPPDAPALAPHEARVRAHTHPPE